MLSIKLIPKEIMEQSIREAEHLWENGKPKKWYYSIPIVLIWVLIILLLLIKFVF